MILFAGGVAFGGALSGNRDQSVFKLFLDIDIFEDREFGTSFFAVIAAGSSGHDHDWDLRGGGLALDRRDQFAATHDRHLHIRNDQAREDALEDLERFNSVRGGLYAETMVFEKAADGMPDHHRIIDDQRHNRHASAPNGRTSVSRQ